VYLNNKAVICIPHLKVVNNFSDIFVSGMSKTDSSGKVKLSRCLINRHAMKTYGGVEAWRGVNDGDL
jgi:hypothetical protein